MNCLVNGGFPLFWWKKPHASHGCFTWLQGALCNKGVTCNASKLQSIEAQAHQALELHTLSLDGDTEPHIPMSGMKARLQDHQL